MDHLYHKSNILWATRNPSRVEPGGHTVLLEPEANNEQTLLARIRSRQKEAHVTIVDLVNGFENFHICHVDASQALQRLQDDDSVMLERIPMLTGFRTSQFEDVVQFHDPGDPSKNELSATFYLDRYDRERGRGHRLDSSSFVMGGFKSLDFQPFNTRGNPPRNLLPGNEVLITNHYYDYYDTAQKIRELLERGGFHFEEHQCTS